VGGEGAVVRSWKLAEGEVEGAGAELRKAGGEAL
jgi:hypothetical protein